MALDYKLLGRVLKSFRQRACYDQAEAAKKLGVTRGYISMVETANRASPGLRFLAKACEVYDMKMSDLFLLYEKLIARQQTENETKDVEACTVRAQGTIILRRKKRSSRRERRSRRQAKV